MTLRVGPYTGARSPSRREDAVTARRRLRGHRLLVIGGATGTGLALVRTAHRLGADVVVTTRSRERFERSVAAALGRDRVRALIADLTDHDRFAGELEALIRRDGFVPTAIVHSAAAGMDGFATDLARLLVPLRRAQPACATAVAHARDRLRAWALREWDAAMAVNFHGHVNVVRSVRRLMPSGTPSRIIHYSSLWTDLGWIRHAPGEPGDPRGSVAAEVPSFYTGVAGSKRHFVRWLEDHAAALVAERKFPAIVSGHVITDVPAGKLVDRYVVSLLPPEDRRKMRRHFITAADFVRATVDLLHGDPAAWPEYPYKRFVVGGRPVSRRMSSTDPVFEVRLPL